MIEAPALPISAVSPAGSSAASRPRAGRRARPASGRRIRGLSLIEVMISLAITSALLTATMVALDASFMAYSSASEEASAQAAGRMVMHRLTALVRTSTAHGPMFADATATPPVTLDADNVTLEASFIELVDPKGVIVRIEHRAASDELWYVRNPGMAGETAQPIMGGVTDATFTLRRRRNDVGLWVLERGTVDVSIMPDPDNTLSLENETRSAIRLIASTMPRRLED
jgi:prepilin-type N-terminal cleavage/methylation domain-containing protein